MISHKSVAPNQWLICGNKCDDNGLKKHFCCQLMCLPNQSGPEISTVIHQCNRPTWTGLVVHRMYPPCRTPVRYSYRCSVYFSVSKSIVIQHNVQYSVHTVQYSNMPTILQCFMPIQMHQWYMYYMLYRDVRSGEAREAVIITCMYKK